MRSALLGLCLWGFTAVAMAATPAGDITLATGEATATSRDGSVRNLGKDGKVYSGEFVNTGPNSYLNIKFRDGGLMLLRPNTRFSIEHFEYQAVTKTSTAAPSAEPTPTSGTPPEVSDNKPAPAFTPPAPLAHSTPARPIPAPPPRARRSPRLCVPGATAWRPLSPPRPC